MESRQNSEDVSELIETWHLHFFELFTTQIMRGLPLENKKSSSFKKLVVSGAVLFLIAGALTLLHHTKLSYGQTRSTPQCWQPKSLELKARSEDIARNISAIIKSKDYQDEKIKVFQKAISIDTQTSDDFGDLSDPRWNKFDKWDEFLKSSYPNVYKTLELEVVNKYGKLFHWKPENATAKKPYILLAHQDTVPVLNDTLVEWLYPPFEGVITGDGVIYGRGSHDDKNSLTAIFESLELLIAAGFTPSRPMIIALGFDEEISGVRGAKQISSQLESIYGRDSIEFILDEGPGVVDPPLNGVAYANVAISEKGYLDIGFELHYPGGHSSLAPKHSAIGIAAELIVALENEDYFEPLLTLNNPLFESLACHCEYDESFSEEYLSLLGDLLDGDEKASKVLGTMLAKDKNMEFMLRTTQGIDIVKGGLKINALPEVVNIAINHRISIDSSIDDIKDRLARLSLPIAEKYGLGRDFFGDKAAGDIGSLSISQIGPALNAAKVTGKDEPSFQTIMSTVKTVFTELLEKDSRVQTVLAVPALMAGNTDTRHFWNLTTNIFRFRPTYIDAHNNNGHTVNEHLYIRDHFSAIKFYSTLMLAADEI